MSIHDRGWYREEVKNKSRNNNKPKPTRRMQVNTNGGWDNQHAEPLSKTTLLYMSMTMNVILAGSLAYVLLK